MENPVRIATAVLIPLPENYTLLGRKQGGPEIGEGTVNMPGGKMEPTDKTIRDCAARETLEELGIVIDPEALEKLAVIMFYAAGVPNMEVHFYRAENFTGEPRETESMIPEQHHNEKIPYERMLASDVHWFPKILRGEKFRTNVYYRTKAKGFIKIDPFLPLDSFE